MHHYHFCLIKCNIQSWISKAFWFSLWWSVWFNRQVSRIFLQRLTNEFSHRFPPSTSVTARKKESMCAVARSRSPHPAPTQSKCPAFRNMSSNRSARSKDPPHQSHSTRSAMLAIAASKLWSPLHCATPSKFKSPNSTSISPSQAARVRGQAVTRSKTSQAVVVTLSERQKNISSSQMTVPPSTSRLRRSSRRKLWKILEIS